MLLAGPKCEPAGKPRKRDAKDDSVSTHCDAWIVALPGVAPLPSIQAILPYVRVRDV
jgi:hypothetical protein